MEMVPVTPHHADVLAALHAGAFDAPWSVEAMAAALNTPGTFGVIAALDDQPQGFVLGRAAGGECEVLTLAVMSDARRRGVGRKLMEALATMGQAMGAMQMFLEVADDNTAALALYRSFGFAAAGRRDGYYKRPGGRVDGVIIVLKL